MINHARCLLANLPGQGSGFTNGYPGEEYIPPDYRPVRELPVYLEDIRRQLFGANPDRAYINYRTQQYLALLHSTELAEFVTGLDPRTTYDTNNKQMFPQEVFEVTAPDDLYILEELGSPDGYGRCYHQWRITVTSGSVVTVERLSLPMDTQALSYTDEGTQSSPVSLIGSQALFRFVTPNIGTTWFVEGFARPERDLGEIAAALKSTNPVTLDKLFGAEGGHVAAEPWQTFFFLWKDHPELAYQLGGLLLGVIYRMEQFRTS